MGDTGIISLLLVIANVVFSYKGFTNQSFFDGYKFEVDKILVNKDYKRLITSGFLHVNWTHLIFNMISLVFFSASIESYLGSLPFLIIYMAGLLGGNLLSLFVHRHHGDYSAAGASGAVCGVIFSFIALFPGTAISFFLLPFSIPGWIYGVVYVLYSIYGIRSKKDNIGHDAHLGGALIGMTTALLMQPSAFSENTLTILIIAIPAIAFICLIILKPHFLLIDNFFYRTHHHYYDVDHKYNYNKTSKQAEVDRILDKIGKSGISSLSRKEKQILEQYSRKGR
jgi:membrane associated rhomboid family serine protease